MYSVFNKVKHWLGKPQSSFHPEPTIQTFRQTETDEEIRMVRHGSVTVSKNQVFVNNPDDEGSFATMIVPNNPRMTVTIDGQKCVGRVILHENQDIQVMMTHTFPSRKFSTRVSEDSMKVIARVEVIPGEEYQLKELEHVHHTILEVEECTKTYPEPLEMSAIMARLESAGFQGDLDSSSLERVSCSIETTEAVIVQGKPVIPGKPASYKPVELPKLYDPLHRRMQLSTVTVGTTVALLEPEIPGIPGRNVFGKEIPPPKHKPLPSLGQGVVEVSGRIIAARDGRLLFTKSRIDVVPELIIHHDVSSKDGKVEFDGNVVILGSVLDGSFIKATGSVEVHGGVLCSTVMGERGVFISKAIVGSEIVAGQSKLLYTKLHSAVKRCLADFQRFQVEYTEVVRHVRNQSDQHLRLPLVADALLRQRHTNLDRSLLYLFEDPDNLADTDDRYRRIVLELRSKWHGIGRTKISEQDVLTLRQLLDDYVAYIESIMSAEVAEVSAASVTSSSVRSSGKIVITGAGIYASSIESGDCIVVRGTTRGGFVVAENVVRMYELGTSSGTESSVKVKNPLGKIVIRIRHPNTLLQVGETRDRNLEAEYNAICRGTRNANPDTSRRRLA